MMEKYYCRIGGSTFIYANNEDEAIEKVNELSFDWEWEYLDITIIGDEEVD